ncbi:phytanoyl-CoA dioxygenase family protein [Sphingomonas daechungensis]|uniref:phytanoyl-CoA dioxygenase family protein n=1 Tax=Sphingomonas daechungensis TaxID=1176646 RepID=UPI003784CA77
MTLTAPDRALTYERDGAQHFPGVAKGCVQELRAAFAHMPPERAGVRLTDLPLHSGIFAAQGMIGAVAASVLGSAARAVRAVYFDKSHQANWSLDWHQDRVICVQKRVDVAGFERWTTKAGLVHVSPPFEVLADMVTLRVHLDDVDDGNAPLLAAPGSHRFGKLSEADVPSTVRHCGVIACLAQAGDVWLYSTPILHSSTVSARPSRRRVLQLDYAASELPSGLKWQELT